MDRRSSIAPTKPREPQSFSVILLILGICFVVLSVGIPYMYHESNLTWPPYLWMYGIVFVVGIALIGVNAKRIQKENQQKNKNKHT